MAVFGQCIEMKANNENENLENEIEMPLDHLICKLLWNGRCFKVLK